MSENTARNIITMGQLAPYQLVARAARPQGTRVRVGAVEFGGSEFVVIAGPCAVENGGQIREAAYAVAGAGAHLLRGGAFKPRTSPYSFQGLGEEGLRLLAIAGREVGLPIVTEVLSTEDLPLVSRYADMLQVGARSMQNFALLKALGATNKPVLLKRGLAASIEELLLAAEYIAYTGNPHVVLCERGIRTFETATRNTLDLNAVAALKELTHLPVLVDPSHGTGRRNLVAPLAKASAAVGADGIIIEVHPVPEQALSDGEQSLNPSEFAALMHELACYVPLVARTLAGTPTKDAPTNTAGISRSYRQRIDRLDNALIQLLNERIRVALHIGKGKLATGLPLRDPQREEAVLQHRATMASELLPAEGLTRMFRAVMDETLLAENKFYER